jgi:hypothetical protein
MSSWLSKMFVFGHMPEGGDIEPRTADTCAAKSKSFTSSPGLKQRCQELARACRDVGPGLALSLHQGSLNSERSGLSGPSGMIWNSIIPAWPRGSFSRRSWAAFGSVRFMINTTPL